MARRDRPYDFKRAWNYVLWLLARKAYTSEELRRKLERKKVTPAGLARILERLGEYRFIDDSAYAERYVRGRKAHKGPLALKSELRLRGVPEADIETALDPLDEGTQLEAATALLRKHVWRFTKDDPRKDRARAFAFLSRRGFPSGVAVEALQQADIGGQRHDGEAETPDPA